MKRHTSSGPQAVDANGILRRVYCALAALRTSAFDSLSLTGIILWDHWTKSRIKLSAINWILTSLILSRLEGLLSFGSQPQQNAIPISRRPRDCLPHTSRQPQVSSMWFSQSLKWQSWVVVGRNWFQNVSNWLIILSVLGRGFAGKEQSLTKEHKIHSITK